MNAEPLAIPTLKNDAFAFGNGFRYPRHGEGGVDIVAKYRSFLVSEGELVTAENAPRINLGGIDVNERLLIPRRESRVQFVRSTVSPGDTLTFDGREPHTWHGDTDHESELIWVLAPAAWQGSV